MEPVSATGVAAAVLRDYYFYVSVCFETPNKFSKKKFPSAKGGAPHPLQALVSMVAVDPAVAASIAKNGGAGPLRTALPLIRAKCVARSRSLSPALDNFHFRFRFPPPNALSCQELIGGS